MRRMTSFAARCAGLGAIGLGALAVPAAAQFGPPPANIGAPLWGPGVPPDHTSPVFNADLDGGGHAGFTGVLDEAAGKLCYILSVPGVDRPTAAHIHTGGPGETGGPVVTLAAPEGGSSGGCLTLQADLVRSLVANAGGYYVNVHTAAYPAGMVRGQLEMSRTEG